MSILKPVCIDFESFGILPRPEYPPKPVGVSIKLPGKKAQYYAWGHPAGNNCTVNEAKAALEAIWNWEGGLLMHHAKFDLDVAEVHMGLPMPSWDRIHCTMLLLFLHDPHSDKLGLKPASEKLLGMKPEEQNAVRDWLIQHQPVEGDRITAKNFGAYIAYAPGNLVGTYADGDVIRTEKLFNLLYPDIKRRRMLKPYDRERKLIPILLDIERQGVRVDVARLENDLRMYDTELFRIDLWLRKKLGVSDEFNIDSGQQLIHALIVADLINVKKLGTAPSSKPEKIVYKSDKDSLNEAMTDSVMSGVLRYRSQLLTCVNTFMRSWYEVAVRSDGLIFTQWNQIRSEGSGARTGRFSSSPNFMNVPQMFKPIFKHEETDKERKKKLPKAPWSLPALPLVRSYVIPFKPGHVLLDRDFAGQELRILAHFEDGDLQRAYISNPKLDLHQYAADVVSSTTGVKVSRKDAKTIAFSILYGSGLKLLAENVGCSVEDAQRLKKAYLDTFPGVRELQRGLKQRAIENKPIQTWGGREYFVEPPKIINGRLHSNDYKLLNVLIQGSAADCTKEALISYWATKSTDSYLLLSVHDEILISAPIEKSELAMSELQSSMCSMDFGVSMLSDGEKGFNWSEMQECE